MAKVTLSKAAFENLIKHLVEIEEGKNKLIDQYFPEPSKERNEFEKFIQNYIKQMGQLVRNIDVTTAQTVDNKLPFVTIGSEVEVQDLANQEIYKYRIVSSFHGGVGEGDISCLSPVGKSLLLKKVDDVVEVNAPGGVFRYKIKSIQLKNDIKY
ncbi:GreA/GreB family elongation factor [Desulfofundulus thermocisternus]|uniref:GreA/GreB family elongation factor n=1 Tax=Desulfofundulus thermocisternus TaxID=42471 RepID=UPI0019F893BF|nr:GreA/GreB family elongation factor [Desulfofundulus thermocisternus]MBE3585221.1 GreA/GreB family elongation factor [Thermoanaerobacter sp.]MCS5696064.1 GreA/GreB family elongation factor [Desulfofundulus thermocisternus]